MKQYIVISYSDDEYLPTFTSLGHNLKEKNVFLCESTEVFGNNINSNFVIVHKKIGYGPEAGPEAGPIESIITPLTNSNIYHCKMDIYITYSNAARGMIRGFLYINNKEFPISDCRTYNSLQVGNFAYDNIVAIRVPDDFALEY